MPARILLWSGILEHFVQLRILSLILEFSSHTKVITFADDLVILTQRKTPFEAEVYAYSDLARIEIWANDNKMQFNESKSKALLITRKRSNDVINIYLNNRRLEKVKEMKYLGIYFDSRLTCHKHIEHIAEKSRTLIYMLSKSVKLQWSLGHKSLKMVYEGALVPLMYVCLYVCMYVYIYRV
jgi:hypothetical protein